jgi:hypothetical protein
VVFVAKTLDVETLEMVTYLVMVMVEVRVEASSAMARRGRSAVATMVVSCITTQFPFVSFFMSLGSGGVVELIDCDLRASPIQGGIRRDQRSALLRLGRGTLLFLIPWCEDGGICKECECDRILGILGQDLYLCS